MFALVRDYLVCLDDFERRGDNLNPRDVLGLVSFLREQRNCKVALILNDARLGDEERREFEAHLEKVVDVSLVFRPTPAEAAAIKGPTTTRPPSWSARTAQSSARDEHPARSAARFRLCAMLSATSTTGSPTYEMQSRSRSPSSFGAGMILRRRRRSNISRRARRKRSSAKA